MNSFFRKIKEFVNARTTNLTNGKELYNACQAGDIEVVKQLLAIPNIDIEWTDKEGSTSLIRAVFNEHAQIVKLLLAAGADISHKNKYGITPLYCSLDAQITKMLLEQGANPNETSLDGRSTLVYATEHGKLQVIELLIAGGALVNQKDKYGETALIHHASTSCSDNIEIINALICHGADVNAQDNNGWTALMHLHYGCSPVQRAKFLIAAGADTTIKNGDGKTALILAQGTLNDLMEGMSENTCLEEEDLKEFISLLHKS